MSPKDSSVAVASSPAPNEKLATEGDVKSKTRGQGRETPSVVTKELLYEGHFYDVTEWVKRHPGGKIIEFYTKSGEDCTLAVQQFHQRSTKRVMAIMKSLRHRPATAEEDGLGLSPATLARHKALTKDFLKLHNDLVQEGYFKPSIPHLIYRLTELVLFAAIGLHFLTDAYSGVYRLLGVLSFAMFGGRCGWLMHEGGHHSLTGNSKVDRFLQALIYGVGDGMSSSWWSSQHNRHHAMPQRLKHDVDLRTLPLIAFNSKVVKKPEHGRTFLIQNQATLFMALDTFLVAMFWKLYLHPMYIIKKGNYREFIFIGFHYYMAYQIGVLNYLLSGWLASVYIFGNFALSHTHLPVTSESLHWVEYALLHTVDIQPSWWCDWWMSFLNYQIEHHLFPTMPQFRHRLINGRVRELAEKYGLPYQSLGYGEAVVKTFRNLHEVSKELRHSH